MDLGGSYLLPTGTVNVQPSNSQGSSLDVSTNTVILTMLQKLDNFNKAIAQCLDRVKQRSFTSTPVNQRLHAPMTNTNPQISLQVAGYTQPQNHMTLGQSKAINTNIQRSGTVSGICSSTDTQDIRWSTIWWSINKVLAFYEAEACRGSLQGKPIRKSGRYNTVETITIPAHLCWRNEERNFI